MQIKYLAKGNNILLPGFEGNMKLQTNLKEIIIIHEKTYFLVTFWPSSVKTINVCFTLHIYLRGINANDAFWNSGETLYVMIYNVGSNEG